MKNLAIAALAVVALGAAIAWAQSTGWPPPAGSTAILCVYNSSPPTMSNGTPGYAQCDVNGKLISGGSSSNPSYVTGTPVAPVTSTTSESSHVLKSSAGSLDNLTITVGATSGWLMLFDATSAPADGAVTPAYYIPVASSGTNGYAALSWGNSPLKFTTGIVAVFSSTGPFTKTASATAQFSGQVQ